MSSRTSSTSIDRRKSLNVTTKEHEIVRGYNFRETYLHCNHFIFSLGGGHFFLHTLLTLCVSSDRGLSSNLMSVIGKQPRIHEEMTRAMFSDKNNKSITKVKASLVIMNKIEIRLKHIPTASNSHFVSNCYCTHDRYFLCFTHT